MKAIVSSIALALVMAGNASAQQTVDSVDVMAFALNHPQDNASLSWAPEVGNSVPDDVRLRQVKGTDKFGYFYYQGEPVIVDMRTRAIVRVGQ